MRYTLIHTFLKPILVASVAILWLSSSVSVAQDSSSAVLPISAYKQLIRLAPGHVYGVIRTLGNGGMSTVYEVENIVTGQRVALKFVTKNNFFNMFKSLPIVSRYLMPRKIIPSAQFLAKNGVAIERIQDVEIMPLGRALSSMAKDKRTVPERIEFVFGVQRDVSQGIWDMNSLGWRHNDIKPANIISLPDRHVLADFDLAEKNGLEFQYGTLDYMSPERIRTGQIGLYSELYALGVSIAAVLFYDSSESIFKDLKQNSGKLIDTESFKEGETRPRRVSLSQVQKAARNLVSQKDFSQNARAGAALPYALTMSADTKEHMHEILSFIRASTQLDYEKRKTAILDHFHKYERFKKYLCTMYFL